MYLRNKLLSIGNAETLLSVHNLETDEIKLIIADETQIPPNSENISTAEIV